MIQFQNAVYTSRDKIQHSTTSVDIPWTDAEMKALMQIFKNVVQNDFDKKYAKSNSSISSKSLKNQKI